MARCLRGHRAMTAFTPPPNEDEKSPSTPLSQKPAFVRGGLIALLILGVGFVWFMRGPGTPDHRVDYTAFRDAVERGDVERVQVRGQAVSGELADGKAIGEIEGGFKTTLPAQEDEILPLLRDNEVAVEVLPVEDGSSWWMLLMPWVLIGLFWWWMSRRARQAMGGQGSPFAAMTQGRHQRFDPERGVKVGFDDVAGLGSAKRDLKEIVSFLREPERYEAVGAEVPRGVLLAGPPGTGKTLLARAVAGEAGVPFFSLSGSDFIEMLVGVGASRVRQLFEKAKAEAPAIIFIDEIDAVGRARGTGIGGGHDEREQTLNQMLHEMDGFESRDQVVVMAATNRPDVIDPALLRPGRFDRQVAVDRPARVSRREILDVHVRNKPLADDVDLDHIARITPGMTGADLANIANEAALLAVRRGRSIIMQQDLADSIDKVVLGDERDVTLGDEDRRRVAIHEAGHAVVAEAVEALPGPHRITILPRGRSLGSTQQHPEEDAFLVAQPTLEAQIAVLLGGRAGEFLEYGHGSTGAADDLKKATDIARRMVTVYGMSEAVGPRYLDQDDRRPFLGAELAANHQLSPETARLVDDEVARILDHGWKKATQILEREESSLRTLVDALLEHESLEGEELTALLAPPNSGPRASTRLPESAAAHG